uniref:Ig-like domain-containing protein n=1 Tax=Anas platyrhynchos TaxID=8839 RepID=A0A8B9TBC9_ANAPL
MQRAALLLIPFLFLSRAQGKLIGKLLLLACLRSSFSCGIGCEDRAVPAGGELWLLPKKPLQAWARLEWRVILDSGTTLVIVRVSKDKDPDFRSNFSRRATFLLETLSLRISPVTQADSGKYSVDFETASGISHSQCFQVSVWGEWLPLSPPPPVRTLQQEQGWCNFLLLCSVPGAAKVFYSWSRDGEPLGHGNMLCVHGDTEPGTYVCNASNLVSWNTATPFLTCQLPFTLAVVLGQLLGTSGTRSRVHPPGTEPVSWSLSPCASQTSIPSVGQGGGLPIIPAPPGSSSASQPCFKLFPRSPPPRSFIWAARRIARASPQVSSRCQISLPPDLPPSDKLRAGRDGEGAPPYLKAAAVCWPLSSPADRYAAKSTALGDINELVRRVVLPRSALLPALGFQGCPN